VAVNHWAANPLARELYGGKKLKPGNTPWFFFQFLKFNAIRILLSLSDYVLCHSLLCRAD